MNRKQFNQALPLVQANLHRLPLYLRKKVMDNISFDPQTGEVNMTALLVVAVLASVTFIVIANLWPSMQTAYIGISTTSGDVASNTSHTMFGLLLWIIPLGLGIALLIKVLKSHE